MNEVGCESVKKVRQRETGYSHSKLDERDTRDDVNGDALKLGAWPSRGDDGNIITEVSLVARHSNHGIRYAVELGQERFRDDDNLHTFRVGELGVVLADFR